MKQESTSNEIRIRVAGALETLRLNFRAEAAAQISVRGVQNAIKIVKKYPDIARNIRQEREDAITRGEREMW